MLTHYFADTDISKSTLKSMTSKISATIQLNWSQCTHKTYSDLTFLSLSMNNSFEAIMTYMH